jgi:hypothetical protein
MKHGAKAEEHGMSRKHCRPVLNGLFSMSRLARIAALCIGIGLSAGCSQYQVFPTGDEQAVIESFLLKENLAENSRLFHNSLDHALCVLELRAYPTPDRRKLVEGAVRSLCREYRQQAGRDVPAATQQIWRAELSQGGSFQAVLNQLGAGRTKPLDQGRLVRAGLDGMLAASGWDHACVLGAAQAAQIEAMIEARKKTGPCTIGPSTSSLVHSEHLRPGVLRIVISSFEGSGIAAKVAEFLRAGEAGPIATLILDVRDNPGGRPEEANGVADLFLDGQVLQIVAFPDGRRIAFTSKPGAAGMYLIVLTNRNTGSSAEMLVMAVQDHHRAVIIGERTAGAVFGKDIQKLTGGETIVFRAAPTVLSPKGTDYSYRGLTPDVVVPDRRGQAKDAILQAAIERSAKQ